MRGRQSASARPRVAVIGGGISGLAAAYRLRERCDVELFERRSDAGGHARTAIVSTPHREVPVDTGFIVYNEATYPGFTSLLRELDVRTKLSDMSFGVACGGCGIEFSSRGLRGFFPTRAERASPTHWRLLLELHRFYRRARRELEGGRSGTTTLGELIAEGGADGLIGRHFLVPLAASVWSSSPEAVADFPLHYLLRFLDNHGLIGWGRQLQWRTIDGGSREYVRRLMERLPGPIHLGSPVLGVTRDREGVTVRLRDAARRFDAVVIACHADEALDLLGDPSPDERAALSLFRYSANRVVLHTDDRLLPRAEPARASWNFRTRDCRAELDTLTMSYDLSRLQSLPPVPRILATVNPPASAPIKDPIAEIDYTHPSYTSETLRAQQLLSAVSGNRRTWYAGAHLGYGFHEDGYSAGVLAAEQLLAAAGPLPVAVPL